ncbi:M56 family metallopeptidase [Formosa sp. 4Alg 33]|uniref:M56 family metallopeptidase n=1 Tax=Formosa sp. 4Alg 33 TaxID=3382189 RepID=UPI003D9C031B
MEYLIKASAVICIFYSCYILLLQKETFFTANRWFLLSGLLITVLLPFVVIPIYINEIPQTLDLSQFTTVEPTSQTSSLSWTTIASVIYITGVVFFLIRFIIECLSLNLFMKSQNIKSEGGFNISETTQDTPPFSFFKTIVYNPSQFTDTELTHIINHEKVHARDYHSVDILISKLATIVFWCNPFIWLYKKALIQNLEFIADYKSIQQTHSTKTYQNVLLKSSVLTHQMPLTTNFYNSLIKKRILMLNTSKSKPIRVLKYVVIAPLLLAFLMSFNTKTVYKTDNATSAISNIDDTEIIGLITKDHSEEQLNAMISTFEAQHITLIIKNVKRNTSNEIKSISIEAKSKDQKVNYNIDSEAPIAPIKISYSNTTNTLSIGKSETSSDIVFTSSKNAKNVNTSNNSGLVINTSDGSGSFVLKRLTEDNTDKNVMFISEDGKTTHVTTSKEHISPDITPETEETSFIDTDAIYAKPTEQNKENQAINTTTDPIYILDGKEITKTELNAINPESIDHINVLKGKKAEEKYGEKGKHGVVEITTKTDTVNSDSSKQSSEIKVIGPSKVGSPLIIVDGNEMSEGDMKKINPDTIESMNVLKDESATKKYGDKAKNGAIEITLIK